MTIGVEASGGEIEILVTQINGNQARLSISAPDDVFILREELLRPMVNRISNSQFFNCQNH